MGLEMAVILVGARARMSMAQLHGLDRIPVASGLPSGPVPAVPDCEYPAPQRWNAPTKCRPIRRRRERLAPLGTRIRAAQNHASAFFSALAA